MWIRSFVAMCAVLAGLSRSAVSQDDAAYEHDRLRKVIMTHALAPGAFRVFLEFSNNGQAVFVGPQTAFGGVPARPGRKFYSTAERAQRTNLDEQPYDSTVAAFDVVSGKRTHKYISMPKFGTNMHGCQEADLSPDGKWLAVIAFGVEGGRVDVFDVATQKPVYVTDTKGHKGVAFVNGSKQFATAGSVWKPQIVLQLHDLATRKVIKQEAYQFTDVSWSHVCRSNASGTRLAVGRSVWDVPTWSRLFGHRTTGDFLLYAITPDGQEILSGGFHKLVLWNGERERSIDIGKGMVTCATIAPSGNHAAAGSRNSIFIVDLTSGTVEETITVHYLDVCALAFSPDGKTLASSSADGSTCLWDVANLTGQE